MKNIGNMLKQAQQMQKQMEAMQEKMADERFEGSAGGGMVKAVVDGKQQIKEIKLDPKVLEEDDVTLVEDLIVTAVSEAQRSAEAKMAETMGRLTGGMKLPF